MAKKKENKINFSFVPAPREILLSGQYADLSAKAIKMLFDLYVQYNGKNNGDFCATWSVMEKRGWKSRDTLGKALKELEGKGFIEKTRQGGTNRCNFYAVSWLPINECGGKLDCRETRVASNDWRSDTQ